MKKQLIIKIPKNAGSEEIKTMLELNHKAYYQGSPMFLFHDWEYDVVELSEPIMFFSEPSQDKYEEFRKVLKKKTPIDGNVAQDH